nr:ABC transporter ATP-binding protein [uncultured Shimia sp.]
MIKFKGVSKGYRVRDTCKVVIDNVTISLPKGRSVALLGRNGVGKSTLLRLIAGSEKPDSGQIFKSGTISWPVGFGGSFHRDLTGAQNVQFVARVYGVDTRNLLAFVEDFAELGAHFRMPLRTYSSGMLARLAFGASMGIQFDTYLVDEVTSVGDAAFRRKSRTVFAERLKQAGAMVVSHDVNQIRQFCDAGLLLENGQLHFFENVEDAIAAHRECMAYDPSKVKGT